MPSCKLFTINKTERRGMSVENFIITVFCIIKINMELGNKPLEFEKLIAY